MKDGILILIVLSLVACSAENDKKAQLEEQVRAQRLKELKLKEQQFREKNVQNEDQSKNLGNTIKRFFEAEKNRNMDEIMAFYAQDIQRYYAMKSPTHNKIRNEYEASWRKTMYAANENPKLRKLSEYTYEVDVDYRFYLSSRAEEKSVKSKLHFTFDENGKIIEVYSLN